VRKCGKQSAFWNVVCRKERVKYSMSKNFEANNVFTVLGIECVFSRTSHYGAALFTLTVVKVTAVLSR
jgi:hypothetical protein